VTPLKASIVGRLLCDRVDGRQRRDVREGRREARSRRANDVLVPCPGQSTSVRSFCRIEGDRELVVRQVRQPHVEARVAQLFDLDGGSKRLVWVARRSGVGDIIGNIGSYVGEAACRVLRRRSSHRM
jgi:hypothetical protein